MDGAQTQNPFSEAKTIPVWIRRDALKLYPYETDGRFAEVKKLPASLSESVRRIIDGSYPFREHPPYGAKRMSELWGQAREQFDWPNDAPMSPEMLIRSIQSTVSAFRPEDGQMLNALIWIAGEQKQRVYSKVIMAAIAQSQALPSGHKDKMPASVENTAFEALWKINDKSCCEGILAMMNRAEHSARLRCAAVFKRYFSTTRLLSLESLGENYYSPGFWENMIKSLGPKEPTEWDRFDTKSLFWEIRYLAAMRLDAKDAAIAELLHDEVSLVRDLASKKYP